MDTESTTANTQAKWVTAYIGLGANLGDARNTILEATQQLGNVNGVKSLELSPLYRTAPIEAGGPDYINAVVRIQTRLEPHELLDTVQAIEQTHGRERPYRNAPRTLDLDVLLYADACVDSPRLIVPHPRMHTRAFVLQPLADLEPNLRIHDTPLSQLLQGCADQQIERL